MTRTLLLAALLLGCSSSKKPAAVDAGAQGAKAAKADEPLQLPTFWDDSSYVRIHDDRSCPEGLWSIFGGAAPGDTDTDKKTNAARRDSLAKEAKSKTYLAQLVGPTYVTVGEYDSSKGEVPITVKGEIDCTDNIGRIAFGFSPKLEARLPDGKDFGEYVWFAQPLSFPVKVKFNEWRTFQANNRAGLEARIVFQLEKTETHKKLVKNELSAEEKAERKRLEIPMSGGGLEDWGAGRLVHAKILGVRIASKGGREEVVTYRP